MNDDVMRKCRRIGLLGYRYIYIYFQDRLATSTRSCLDISTGVVLSCITRIDIKGDQVNIANKYV